MLRKLLKRGGAILPLFFAVACSFQNHGEDFDREEISFGNSIYLDSQWVYVQVIRDSIFESHGMVPSESIHSAIRNFLIRADSLVPITPLHADFRVFPMDGPAGGLRLQNGGAWKLLHPESGLEFDVRKDSIYKVALGQEGERGCEQVPNFKPEVRMSYLRSGPRSAGQSQDSYLLTCREFEYRNDTWVHLYYLIDAEGKRVRLRADSAGRPWLGVVAKDGEIWGAFLKSDSISLLLAPLDPAGADRAITIGMQRKFAPREMLKFHHGRKKLWMEYASYVVNIPEGAASPGPANWIWDYELFVEFPRIEMDPYGKQIRIEVSGPIPREVVYDFSEYMK